MVSHPELGSDPPIGSDLESGCDNINNNAYPCVFIKKPLNGFCIISVYVDIMNIIGTRKEIEEASSFLKTEFKMKDLGKTNYCLNL